MRDKGASVQTVNDWLQAVRQFAKWLADNGRIERSPFTRLKPGNVKLDLRRRRGEFTPDEVSKLLTTTRNSGVSFRSLSGADRAILYRVALGTGYRSAELAALTPFAFDLKADPPTATLAAEFTNNRQGACQPLPAELVSDLRAYLSGRPERDPVWPAGFEPDHLRAVVAALEGMSC